MPVSVKGVRVITELGAEKVVTDVLSPELTRVSEVPRDEAHWLELRSLDLTSTSVAALFGLSPYITEFELFHRFRDKTSGFEANERTRWGDRLEAAIAAGVAEDNAWAVRPMKEYIRIPEARIGSSFDFAIEGTAGFPASGILEIKNVDGLQFRDKWIVDGSDIEAPPHIELQVQHQMLVSGRTFAYIAALIGGNHIALLKREPNEKVIRAIKLKVAEFFNRIDTNHPPSPDFARDSDFISELYLQSTEGKVLDATTDGEIAMLAREYQIWQKTGADAETQKKAIKAHVLTKIGDHAKVLGDGFSISAGTTRETVVESFTKAPYRNFRVYWKKEKL